MIEDRGYGGKGKEGRGKGRPLHGNSLLASFSIIPPFLSYTHLLDNNAIINYNNKI